MNKTNKPILCLDFDGVCHAYESKWVDAVTIPDDAVPGLFEFLEQVAPYFDIQVFSTRSATPEGRDAMTWWFEAQRRKWRVNGGEARASPEVIRISFPEKKPAAFVGIDDRVLTFTGVWPDVEMLRAFKPWNKK